MKDTIALRLILEGLIHNLNNPLNLVLGYAQRMQQQYPDCADAQRIYKAGIQIDDMLKDITQKLWDNSFDTIQELCLRKWLDAELLYLNNYLPIKHHVRINRQDKVEDAEIAGSKLQLSLWYEQIVLDLLKHKEALTLETGICSYDGKLAIYLRPCGEGDCFPDDECSGDFIQPTIPQSVWDANTLYGVCQ
ncbi:MAG TPA: hypothetical protein P5342_00020 [Candidatus Cloacimonadota bacterium]|nr:hypothetical protein [Candidatus Cloacimonadota bacterium]